VSDAHSLYTIPTGMHAMGLWVKWRLFIGNNYD